MTRITDHQEAREFRAEKLSLWRVTFAPLTWALHFAFSYGATALICARAGESGVAALRLGIGLGTLLALSGIVWFGWQAWRQWDVLNDREWENDSGTSEDRHQFLGHAGFLLAIISFIGVAYVSLPILLIGTCR
jgi:hypothetical protein